MIRLAEITESEEEIKKLELYVRKFNAGDEDALKEILELTYPLQKRLSLSFIKRNSSLDLDTLFARRSLPDCSGGEHCFLPLYPWHFLLNMSGFAGLEL